MAQAMPMSTFAVEMADSAFCPIAPSLACLMFNLLSERDRERERAQTRSVPFERCPGLHRSRCSMPSHPIRVVSPPKKTHTSRDARRPRKAIKAKSTACRLSTRARARNALLLAFVRSSSRSSSTGDRHSCTHTLPLNMTTHAIASALTVQG